MIVVLDTREPPSSTVVVRFSNPAGVDLGMRISLVGAPPVSSVRCSETAEPERGCSCDLFAEPMLPNGPARCAVNATGTGELEAVSNAEWAIQRSTMVSPGR